MGPKGKRDMVSKEVRMFEEEQKAPTVVTQTKQCAWTKYNDIEPIKLSWKSLIAMEPLMISFILRSTYDLLLYLPTPPFGQDMTQGQFLSGV